MEAFSFGFGTSLSCSRSCLVFGGDGIRIVTVFLVPFSFFCSRSFNFRSGELLHHALAAL